MKMVSQCKECGKPFVVLRRGRHFFCTKICTTRHWYRENKEYVSKYMRQQRIKKDTKEARERRAAAYAKNKTSINRKRNERYAMRSAMVLAAKTLLDQAKKEGVYHG